MAKKNKKTEIIEPINQLNLYAYDSYFNHFIDLFKTERLPNVMLFNGQKGLGKATFAYHFINYILSEKDKKNYKIDDFKIDNDSKNYKLLCNNTHPNFFLLSNTTADGDIKIEQARNLITFLNKTTYNKDIKIILIDNAENLNLNSANAILKALEEPKKNSFFFIIHDNKSKILETVKSRCLEFKFFQNINTKKDVLSKILKQHNSDFDISILNDDYYYNTPGNLLKYILFFEEADINFVEERLNSILYVLEKYKTKKDSSLLPMASYFIEKYFIDNSKLKTQNINSLSFKRDKILNEIKNMKQFNLDKKNLITSFNEILTND